jgi:sortase A
MGKVYTKTKTKDFRIILRGISILIFLSGICAMLYIFFPLLSWEVYFAPVFAADDVASPIPKTTIVNENTIQSLLANSFSGIDYSNAANWFPTYNANLSSQTKAKAYTIAIPKLGIKQAHVSTVDNDLDHHLVNYGGTALPPEKGNAVIFGHSTLPQLFNPDNYKAIFATAHTLKVGDTIIAHINDISYTYKIFNITIVNPDDTSIFTQHYDDSYLTLVTCTPPGTTWKRLIIKSRVEKL